MVSKNIYLPPELWDKIFTFLDIKNLIKVLIVSKYFHQIVYYNKHLNYSLILVYNNKYNSSPSEQFIWACKEGKIEIVKWLFSSYSKSIPELSPSYKIPSNCHGGSDICTINALEFACGNRDYSGNKKLNNDKIETVKWLLDTYCYPKQIIRSLNSNAFERACNSGNLEIAQELFKKFGLASYSLCYYTYYDFEMEENEKVRDEMDLSSANLALFSETCFVKYELSEDEDNLKIIYNEEEENCKLEVIKWLIKIFNITKESGKDSIIDILNNISEHIYCQNIFSNQKEKCSLKIIKFLIKNFKLTASEIGLISLRINADHDKFIFENFCRIGCLDILKWIIKFYIKKGEITEEYLNLGNFHLSFSQTIIKNKIVESLIDIFPLAVRKDTNSKACDIVNRSLKINTVKWLIDTFNLPPDSVKGRYTVSGDTSLKASYYRVNGGVLKLAHDHDCTDLIDWLAKRFKYKLFDELHLTLLKAIDPDICKE